MSDYVRKKCVRFKIPQNIIDELKNEEDWIVDLLLEKYQLKDKRITTLAADTLNQPLCVL